MKKYILLQILFFILAASFLISYHSLLKKKINYFTEANKTVTAKKTSE